MKNRKTTTQFAIALTFMFGVLTACNTSNSSEEHADHNMENHDHSNMEMESATVEESNNQYGAIGKESVDQLIAAYIEIKDALIETDAELAKDKAENFLNGLDEEVKKGLETLTESVSNIAKSSEVESQRTDFEVLSKEMYELIKTKDANTTVYKQYCPMAFNSKGAFWLSVEEQVLNPYFGDKMLKCGRVEETLGSNE
ncbi:MAG: DUF3347 domain-containing protein [Cyclobacteriaceae bacterium]|nr:DUF3347 domain-containing protein [Cyclobacteriaceae bacterium]